MSRRTVRRSCSPNLSSYSCVPGLSTSRPSIAEAAYLGDTLEPSDSEDEMEAESDLDNGDEEITDLVSDGENA